MKNILFISYDGLTDPLGQSQIIPYLTGLSKYGYQFTILSCEKPLRFSKYKDEVKTQLQSYHINWVPITYHKNPPVISTLFDVWYLKKKSAHLHHINRFDMVHTRPGIPALVGLWMKNTFGIKYLNDIREFYADSRVDGGLWNVKNFLFKRIYRWFKQREKEGIEKSDGIVCLTQAAKDIIQKWPEYKSQTPLQVIPCSVDLDKFDPEKIKSAEKERLRSELGLKAGEIIISYLGSIGSWYMTEELMTFFKKIYAKLPESKFLFISPSEHSTILSAARKAGVPEKRLIIRNAKRSEVPLLLSLSKFSVFFIKPCYSKLSSSPTKHGEIMAMGVPVITNKGVGDVAEIVKNSNSGITLKDFSENEMENIATKAIFSSFDSTRIRKAAFQYYDLENAVFRYHLLYDRICGISEN